MGLSALKFTENIRVGVGVATASRVGPGSPSVCCVAHDGVELLSGMSTGLARPEQVAPNWDVEQLEIILEAPSAWQLVNAGPGAGKSDVACQRVAFLVDQGVAPSRILLVSFTRTAVAELRDRIVSYAVAGEQARSVRISTIDSHAWRLRTRIEDEDLPPIFGDGSYDLSIARTVELFRNKQPDLLDFMSRLEHLIVDEAQDVMGVRADLILEMLRAIPAACGVTVLADPAQAIYGFTTDDTDETTSAASLLSRIDSESPRPFIRRTLQNIHRIKNSSLVDVFMRTRKDVELAENATGHVARVHKTIRDSCGQTINITSYESLADFLSLDHGPSTLVLLRRRADVLFASSYCSAAGVHHRLRMSDLPIVVRPWIGWLFGETTRPTIGREDYDKLWEARSLIAPEPLAGEVRDECWSVLHHLAAATRAGAIDLVQLRRLVSRSRPPLEICYPELGTKGPILGTIHASKGREADTVVLVLPPADADDQVAAGSDASKVFEEGRVYYVGATRARQMLVAAGTRGAFARRMDSGRVFKLYERSKAQLEIGRTDDVDKTAHLAWSNSSKVQHMLASCVGHVLPATARAVPEDEYRLRIIVERKGADGVTHFLDVGQLSASFQYDLSRLWSLVDTEGRLRPMETIHHLHLMAVTTVGFSEEQRDSLKPPFNQSGLALAPVVKGFPTIRFTFRRTGRTFR
jgi:hypothetical protein